MGNVGACVFDVLNSGPFVFHLNVSRVALLENQ